MTEVINTENTDLAQVTLDELLEKAYRYDRYRLAHNEKMKRYREKYLETYKPKANYLAKRLYWRKRGFELLETGEKIKIEEVPEIANL